MSERENDMLNNATTPWHESELMRVTTSTGKQYKLAYDFENGKTMLHIPGYRLSIKDAEAIGLKVEFPTKMREIDPNSKSAEKAVGAGWNARKERWV